MAKYRISGVWKDTDGVITHYAFHEVTGDNTTGYATKKSKKDAVALLKKGKGNSATTWLWDYQNATWKVGTAVEVIEGATEEYLRTIPDSRVTDNLDHLIDFDWITNRLNKA